jgi:putative transposon-encoded protein
MRKINVEKGRLTLKDNKIIGFLERVVTPIGNSGKADVPKRFIGHRAYVIITKEKMGQK